MTKTQEILMDCLMTLKVEDSTCIAILQILKKENQQIEMIEWLAKNRKSSADKILNQAIEIYKEK